MQLVVRTNASIWGPVITVTRLCVWEETSLSCELPPGGAGH